MIVSLNRIKWTIRETLEQRKTGVPGERPLGEERGRNKLNSRMVWLTSPSTGLIISRGGSEQSSSMRRRWLLLHFISQMSSVLFTLHLQTPRLPTKPTAPPSHSWVEQKKQHHWSFQSCYCLWSVLCNVAEHKETTFNVKINTVKLPRVLLVEKRGQELMFYTPGIW